MKPKFVKILSYGVTFVMVVTAMAGSLPGLARPVHAAPGDIQRVSIASGGVEADGRSIRPVISGDGRFVAFVSNASNLVSGDTNGADDIFVHDRLSGQTTRVSVDSSGLEANGASTSPAISSNGQLIAFASDASNLVSGDTNGMTDIFVHDRLSGQTTRVSVDSSGAQANDNSSDWKVAISGDGRYVAFSSDATNLVSADTNGVADVFVHDRISGQTIRVSVDSSGLEANGSSSSPSLSGDGRCVAFLSSATNLVGGDTNGKQDAFVRDLQTGVTSRVSVSSAGAQANGRSDNPSISGDGRYVAFVSEASNLDPRAYDFGMYELAYVHDRQTGQTTLASVNSAGGILSVGSIYTPAISANGRYVAFTLREHGDSYARTSVYDLLTGNLASASFGIDGDAWPSLSADGSLVAFSSLSSLAGDTNGQEDVFVREVAYGPESDPAVVSVTPECQSDCPYPTPASVNFIVIFSEQVTGVTADDFSLTMLDGVSGASITAVSGYGNQYFVSVDTGTGDGRLRLDVVDDDSIVDSALNPLGGPGAGNGNQTGSSYPIHKSPAVVMSITRADADPTAAETVRFTVTFSKAVWPVETNDFVLTTSGSLSGASVASVAGLGSSYTVTVNTGTGEGTLRLDVTDDDSILDDLDHPLGGEGIGNGDFTAGEVYTIVRNAPLVTASLRADPDPNHAASVRFNVTFSTEVSGVDASDFLLTTTGALTGAVIQDVSGNGNAYTITVDTGSGDGSLRLDLVDDDSIQDASGRPLGGEGTGNGNFTAGEVYTIDRTLPMVVNSLRADANPSTAASVNFTVAFSEAVSGVDASDFALTRTGGLAGVSITGVVGSGSVYVVTAATGSGDGTLRLDIVDDDSILDVSGNPLGGVGSGNGNYTAGEAYTFARTPVNKIIVSFRSTGANDGWVLESSEDSNQGGMKDSTAATFALGDDAQDRQFRAILHFPTHYLPDNAVITRALLMIKKEGQVGENPFTTHQNIVVDIRQGAFGYFGPFPFRGLQALDFHSPASIEAAGVIANNPLNDWYWTWLDGAAFPYINVLGITQIRLRFQLDDNDDMADDYLRFYSGDYIDLTARPHLLVEYYLAR